MTDNRNTILAVILSGLVLIAWQYFYNVPQMERQRAAEQGAEPSWPRRPRRSRRDAAGVAAGRHRARPIGPGAGSRDAAADRAGRQPRGRDRGDPAGQDRDPAPHRQHLAEGRPHRRSGAGAVPRDGRSDLAGDRAVFAVGHREPLLCRVRLGADRGLHGPAARPDHDLGAGRHRQPDPEHAGDAEI